MKYRRDIDGLRAVAVLPVVLFHFGISAIPGGFTGVDIFFVISGYLITGSLLDDLERGQFSIISFYWRRARRILPALIFVTLLTCIAALFILLPSDLHEFSLSVIAASTFWSNIYFWKTSNYFSIDAELRPLLHTWSLSVEEQYYIFAPILMFLIYRYFAKRWLTILLPIILGSFVLAVMATWLAPNAGFYLLPTRVWELMLGAVLMLKRPPPLSNRFLMELVGLAGFGLLAIGFFAISESDPFPGYNALYPCLGTALLIYVGQNSPSTTATRILEVRPLVWIGLISYSLYLVHWPINAFAHYLSLQKLDPSMTVAMTVASFALAAFSWKYIEQPFRQKRSFTAPVPIFALSAGAIALLCVGGAAGALGNGFPQRFPDYAQQRIPVGDWGNGTCFNEGSSRIESWNIEDCTRTRGFPTTVLLWGDSFAAHYVSGLDANINQLQANIVEYTYAGCPPILTYFSYARPDCMRFNQQALKVIQDAGIKTVVLSGRWTDYEARSFDGLQQTIDTLRGRGVRVFVIGQSPQFITDVRKIAFFAKRENLDDTSWPMAMDPDINNRVRAFTKGATFIDPLNFLCSAGRCSYADAGQFLYFDYGHFSSIGAALAVSKYWPAFAADDALATTE
ncbi:acyltransferase family protein [Mesorhizobium sp.]|uniref:acyltransferase family protein n=1 Tax=Mesorhizobium sp. TaxID=1871066 RepID=UPI000FE492B2|nr:acyltransferase family protein [Mesorhizobium sp.]RWK60067.1 MAG: acyltransferase [Mesorhizobium sp.]RWM44789.1 MAG: acyltransferase [Mesorhizobium sp.]RWM55697.1 MAG: acyltransferase [Mesorhizobium sp.]RWN05171.1 MAG: acyltransferase [Mesorhizobium sp.]TIO65908.1 MAG: acyltransferase [Mesorhizobium sp.]